MSSDDFCLFWSVGNRKHRSTLYESTTQLAHNRFPKFSGDTLKLESTLRGHGLRNTGRYLVTMSLDLWIALHTAGGWRVRFFFCSQPLKSLYAYTFDASIPGRASIVIVVNY